MSRGDAPRIVPDDELDVASVPYGTLPIDGLALPTAYLFASIVAWSRLATDLALPARVTLHELGHAIVAWLGGRFAMPLPFIGLTTIALARTPGLRALVLVALVAALAFAVRRGHRVAAGALGATLVAHAYLSWICDDAGALVWVHFGGVAGEIVLGAALSAAFYVRGPRWLRWDFWRFPGLACGAVVLVGAEAMWAGIAADPSNLPVHGLTGGPTRDSDVARLLASGFTATGLAWTYVVMARLALFALIVLWGVFLVRAIAKARAGAARG